MMCLASMGTTFVPCVEGLPTQGHSIQFSQISADPFMAFDLPRHKIEPGIVGDEKEVGNKRMALE